MASPQNPLDHKLPKNDLAGKGANAKGKQRFRANPLSGFGKGRDVRCANKLAFPAGRHSLVFRSMLDGVKLIEAIAADEKESKLTVMPAVPVTRGQSTPTVRPSTGGV